MEYTTDPQIRHYIAKAHAERSTFILSAFSKVGQVLRSAFGASKAKTNGPDHATRPVLG